ncbi:MAG: DUF433 domain-containing protein [Thermoguttaceae bacterium]
MIRHDAPTASWIQETIGVCGGEACIRNTRHTVRGLVQWRKLGLSDDQILQQHPDLTQPDLDLAVAYYAEHQAEIDQAIGADE